jgi:hypothetical protein
VCGVARPAFVELFPLVIVQAPVVCNECCQGAKATSWPATTPALAHTAGVHAGRYRGGIGDPAGLPDSRARSRGTGWPGSARE